MKYLFFILGVSIIFPLSLQAEQSSNDTHYIHGPYKITKYRSRAEGFVITLKGASAAKSTCGGNRFMIKSNSPFFDNASKAALAAFMGQKPVKVHLRKGSSAACAAEIDMLDVVH